MLPRNEFRDREIGKAVAPAKSGLARLQRGQHALRQWQFGLQGLEAAPGGRFAQVGLGDGQEDLGLLPQVGRDQLCRVRPIQRSQHLPHEFVLVEDRRRFG